MVEICDLFTNLGIPERLWEIRAHLSHENLAKEISKVNCGVIPYANTPFNNERFPIKLVEFAAASVPILISDIPSHRLLIPHEGALFFKPDSESLLEAINLRYSDLLNTEQRTEWAYKWSGSFTYETRVKTVLQFL
jgi:glycosyltransferase involved in cell wall biosynthesis